MMFLSLSYDAQYRMSYLAEHDAPPDLCSEISPGCYSGKGLKAMKMT